jgi:prevent-host-death family protein
MEEIREVGWMRVRFANRFCRTILVLYDQETGMSNTLSLTHAKARLSEVVRTVRTLGQETIITVDGEPAVRVVPVAPEPRPLSEAEVASVRVLLASLDRIERPSTEFDAVDLVGEGRR